MTETPGQADQRVEAAVLELVDRLPADGARALLATTDLHELVAAVLKAADRAGAPEWAEPVMRYLIHCRHCDAVYNDPEWETPAAFRLDSLRKLDAYAAGVYALDDAGWHVTATAPYCPTCWSVSWCELCRDDIHAWEEYKLDEDGNGVHVHCEERRDEAQAAVDAWNAKHPVGTPVRYRFLTGDGGLDTVTAGPATIVGHPVVPIKDKHAWKKGVSNVLLERVEVRALPASTS